MSKDKAPVEKEMKEKTNEFQQDKLEYIKSPVVMEFWDYLPTLLSKNRNWNLPS